MCRRVPGIIECAVARVGTGTVRAAEAVLLPRRRVAPMSGRMCKRAWARMQSFSRQQGERVCGAVCRVGCGERLGRDTARTRAYEAGMRYLDDSSVSSGSFALADWYAWRSLCGEGR